MREVAVYLECQVGPEPVFAAKNCIQAQGHQIAKCCWVRSKSWAMEEGQVHRLSTR